jgi:hypothetical protein
MTKLSFKIWGIANLIVFAIFSIALFHTGIEVGLLAVLFSSLFSLPAILILNLLLRFLKHIRGGILFSWIVLLVGTALSAFVPYSLFNLWQSDLSGELNFVLPLSFISGYSAVLLFSPVLHYLFQTFQYENESY